MASKQSVTVDDILREHSADVRRIVEALREIIADTLEGVTEKAYPGWHGIGFRHPRAGYICGVFPQVSSVRLLFEKGVLLSDPQGLLEGDGKQTRHIDIIRTADIPADAIRLYLMEAVSL